MSEHHSNPIHDSAEFVEGTHPGAYDHRGNFQGNHQVEAPAAETAGFRAEGGQVRRSIRDRIAAVRPYKSEIVKVPEWDDVEIEVRSISLGERNAIMAEIMDEDGNADLQRVATKFIQECSYDPETGEKVFGPDDEEFINSRDAGSADLIGQAAMRMSGMGKQAEEAEAKKSSPEATLESSSK